MNKLFVLDAVGPLYILLKKRYEDMEKKIGMAMLIKRPQIS